MPDPGLLRHIAGILIALTAVLSVGTHLAVSTAVSDDPPLHNGQALTLEAVLGLYAQFSARSRNGTMHNPAPELQGMRSPVPTSLRSPPSCGRSTRTTSSAGSPAAPLDSPERLHR
jgi:hypothetical protein